MTQMNDQDTSLFAAVRQELFVAVVGDILDKLGFQRQFLPQKIAPIDSNMIILGRAMPVLEADFFGDAQDGHHSLSAKPFGFLFEALDDLQSGEVYVCSGASPSYALWGGLMTTRALHCGAVGAVLDGFHRDTNEILRLQFPVASLGAYAQDQAPRGKVVDWRIPIAINGVSIRPGDVIYGDRDGVLVIPKEVVKEAFALSFEKVRGENQVLKALQNGMRTADAFAQFGIM